MERSKVLEYSCRRLGGGLSAGVDAFLFTEDVARAQKSATEGHLANLIYAFNFYFPVIEETPM